MFSPVYPLYHASRRRALTPTLGAVVFICLQYNSFENTLGKEEIACNKKFLVFPVFFLPCLRISPI